MDSDEEVPVAKKASGVVGGIGGNDGKSRQLVTREEAVAVFRAGVKALYEDQLGPQLARLDRRTSSVAERLDEVDKAMTDYEEAVQSLRSAHSQFGLDIREEAKSLQSRVETLQRTEGELRTAIEGLKVRITEQGCGISDIWSEVQRRDRLGFWARIRWLLTGRLG